LELECPASEARVDALGLLTSHRVLLDMRHSEPFPLGLTRRAHFARRSAGGCHPSATGALMCRLGATSATVLAPSLFLLSLAMCGVYWLLSRPGAAG
jgi:hypothetical protein